MKRTIYRSLHTIYKRRESKQWEFITSPKYKGTRQMLPEMGKSKSGGKGLPDRIIIRTMSGEGRTNRMPRPTLLPSSVLQQCVSGLSPTARQRGKRARVMWHIRVSLSGPRAGAEKGTEWVRGASQNC